jgi:hypothetical protein
VSNMEVLVSLGGVRRGEWVEETGISG